jgi:ABC-2 type transport system permease protein
MSGTSFSPSRVRAMVERHVYVLRGSWPRLLELIYWPAVQMLTWGFLQVYVGQASGRVALAAGTFIGAMLLWDVLFRSGLGFSISFLEEMWAKNLGNLMMSPLRPSEFVASLVVMSTIRLAIGLVPVTFMAIAFFGFNLWGMGVGLGAFFANLVLTSWAVSLVISGLILRHGLGAEGLAWSITFIMLPLCAVYYPVSVLPGWLQVIAWTLPPTYVFEGMRALLLDGHFRGDLMATAFAINVLLFGLAWMVFLRLLKQARVAGSLLQTGE